MAAHRMERVNGLSNSPSASLCSKPVGLQARNPALGGGTGGHPADQVGFDAAPVGFAKVLATDALSAVMLEFGH